MVANRDDSPASGDVRGVTFNAGDWEKAYPVSGWVGLPQSPVGNSGVISMAVSRSISTLTLG